MRKTLKIIIPTLLLAAGVTVCVIRWQAWFGMPDEPQWTGDTLSYVFPTFVQDSVPGFVRTAEGWQDTITPDTLNLLVLGDVHNCLQHDDYDTLAARVPQADAVIQVGDWLDRGYFYYHQLLLREWTKSALMGLPVINCPGNHEYNKSLKRELAPQWNEWFPQTNSSTVPGIFYYVDFPQARFIVLDTNPLVRLVYMTRAITWLRGAINSADGRFVIVVMHHPVLSAGKGRFNPAVYASFRLILQEADLVLAGHDHSYMRSMPFVVLNTAGKTKEQKEKLSAEHLTTEPVYSLITFGNDSSFLFRTYQLSDGALIDSVYVSHH